MNRYKPEHLGKVMPEEPPKLKGFLQDNYEQFSKVYDSCKDNSEDINDLTIVSSKEDSISVKVSTAKGETLQEISDRIEKSNDEEISMSGDVITSKKKKSKKQEKQGE